LSYPELDKVNGVCKVDEDALDECSDELNEIQPMLREAQLDKLRGNIWDS
jgi:hypothetical protein